MIIIKLPNGDSGPDERVHQIPRSDSHFLDKFDRWRSHALGEFALTNTLQKLTFSSPSVFTFDFLHRLAITFFQFDFNQNTHFPNLSTVSFANLSPVIERTFDQRLLEAVV
jgi:hypothetical protein